MYVDIDRSGEVSVAQMTIEEAFFLQKALSIEGCCPECTKKAAAFARLIHNALGEYSLRQKSGADAAPNIPDISDGNLKSEQP